MTISQHLARRALRSFLLLAAVCVLSVLAGFAVFAAPSPAISILVATIFLLVAARIVSRLY